MPLDDHRDRRRRHLDTCQMKVADMFERHLDNILTFDRHLLHCRPGGHQRQNCPGQEAIPRHRQRRTPQNPHLLCLRRPRSQPLIHPPVNPQHSWESQKLKRGSHLRGHGMLIEPNLFFDVGHRKELWSVHAPVLIGTSQLLKLLPKNRLLTRANDLLFTLSSGHKCFGSFKPLSTETIDHFCLCDSLRLPEKLLGSMKNGSPRFPVGFIGEEGLDEARQKRENACYKPQCFMVCRANHGWTWNANSL
ncbi:MAG: hypothetical protein HUU04_03440 [Verrucomicrobiae bacterium]|nr:hypothetical protein [Verrucomicrobiae bacterium]